MSKALPQAIRLTLNSLAGKLDAGVLAPDDKDELVRFIRKIAAGQSVDEIFSIWRPANRPKDPACEQRMRELADLTLPVLLGGEGKPVDEAVAIIAGRYNRKPSTIKRQYHSPEGQKIREETRKIAQTLSEMRDPAPWGGGKSPE
jgi:hypothetical protein